MAALACKESTRPASWRATEKSARNSAAGNVVGPSPKPYMLYGSAVTVSLFSIASGTKPYILYGSAKSISNLAAPERRRLMIPHSARFIAVVHAGPITKESDELARPLTASSAPICRRSYCDADDDSVPKGAQGWAAA